MRRPVRPENHAPAWLVVAAIVIFGLVMFGLGYFAGCCWQSL